MKKLVIITTALFLSFSILSGQQGKVERRGQNNGKHHKAHMHALNLSDEQKENIRELRLEFSKNTLDQRNEIRELNAKYKTLISGENQNLGEIDQNIEKRQALKTSLMKEKVRLNMDIRKILSEEQKIILDTRPGKAHEPKKMHPENRRI